MSPLSVRRLRRRRLLRRVGIGLVALTIIAGTTAGLVWVMEHFRIYAPKYYEPKDIERERYEMQRLMAVPSRTSERPCIEGFRRYPGSAVRDLSQGRT